MPEYLAPGVYVVEIPSNAKSIEGVSTSTLDFVGRHTVAALQRLSQHPRPEWTDFNDSDPGITLLELFAFLTESLLYRADRLPERGLLHAGRLAAAALALVGDCEQPCGSVLKKVSFFERRRLEADDLCTEQEYARRGVS